MADLPEPKRVESIESEIMNRLDSRDADYHPAVALQLAINEAAMKAGAERIRLRQDAAGPERSFIGAVNAAIEELQTPAAQADLLREIFGNPFRLARLPTVEIRCESCRGRGEMDVREGGYNEPSYWVRVQCLDCHGSGSSGGACPWLRWNDGIVSRLATGIYDERRWGDMGILADALLDAGCDDESLLAHLRGREECLCRYRKPHPNGLNPSCLRCDENGMAPLRGPHVRGCWALDLLLGKS